jgi:hypothetical protein
MKKNKGILYVATGKKHVKEAKISVEHVNRCMPNIDTTLVTNVPNIVGKFKNVMKIDNPSHGFEDKIRGMRKSPYKYTLFLDTDIYVREPIHEVFDVLDNFDVSISINQNRDLHTSNVGVPNTFPEYNSGVFAFATRRVSELFELWTEYYDDEHHSDQVSLRKALYDISPRISPLPIEYNYLPRVPAHLVKPVKVLHGRLLEIESKGANQYYDIEKINDELRDSTRHKLMSRGGYEKGVYPPLLERMKISIRERGVLSTVTRIISKKILP